jgi:hypothetical protein
MFCRCFGITGKMPTVTRELNSITRVWSNLTERFEETVVSNFGN